MTTPSPVAIRTFLGKKYSTTAGLSTTDSHELRTVILPQSFFFGITLINGVKAVMQGDWEVAVCSL